MAGDYPIQWTRIGNGTRIGYSRYRCSCGREREVLDINVRIGTSRSCGCKRPKIKHGGTGTPEYAAYHAMLQRCHNPRCVEYRRYGERGISVCARWRMKRGEGFKNFLADMGKRPDDSHSIDRIDNDGNYEPGNCRWALDTEQNRNKGNNHNLTHNGITKCLHAWAEEYGISPQTLTSRIAAGWDVERALTTEPPPPAKELSADEIDEIRRRYHKGSYTDGGPALAREFGVSFQTIMRVVKYEDRYSK